MSRFRQFINGFTQKTSHSVDEQLWGRTYRAGEHRSAQSQRFNIYHAKRLRPVNRYQKRKSIAHQLAFSSLIQLSKKLDKRMIQKWLYDGSEIIAVLRTYLCGDLERNTGSMGNLDGTLRPLVGRDAANETQILSGLR